MVLVGKSEGKRPLGRPRRRWEVNIKMDLREIGWIGMYWLNLAQYKGPVERCCKHGNKPSVFIKYWKILE
jgi:hypothetical protein